MPSRPRWNSLLSGLEHLRHEPVSRERGDELPVDPSWCTAMRDRREDVSRQGLGAGQQVAMSGAQMRIRGAHGMTATPTRALRCAYVALTG